MEKMKEKKASGIWKKVLGICLAVIMVIGMTMPAWAQIDAESVWTFFPTLL